MFAYPSILFAQNRPTRGASGLEQVREADISRLPPQILLSKAWASFDLRRIGDAHLYANAAWKKSGQNLPEANFVIGLVHYSNADYLLAKRYFERALNEEKQPNSRIYYMYATAAVQVAEAKINDYSDTMKMIMQEGITKKVLDVLKNQRQQARRILFRNGLDRVLDLYRWPSRRDTFAAESLAMLIYQKSVQKEENRLPNEERPLFQVPIKDKTQPLKLLPQDDFGPNMRADVAEAVELLIYSLNSQVSTIIQRLLHYRPDYKFTTFPTLLQDVQSYQEIQEYIQQGGVYRTYYLLAVAMCRYNPDDTQYKILLNHLRMIPGAGEWAIRAQSQFDMPYTETYQIEDTQLIAVSQGLSRSEDPIYGSFF
ncbi:MAG: hypothetical protein ACRCVN_02405 [Spirochaetia bacterium]